MSLPVTFNELPRNSKLMFTLYDDSESSKALASASLSLFTEKNTLRQGLQRMELTFTSYAREIVLRALNPSLMTSAPPPSTPSPSAPPTTTTSPTTTTTDLYDEMFLLDKRLEAYRRGWGLGHRSGTTHPDSSVVVPGVSHSAILRENRWLNKLMLDRVRAIERANLAAEDVAEESLNPNSFLVIQLPHFKSPIVYAERPYVMDSDSVSKRLNETWVEETEPFTGRSYFSNTKTHACQWAAPKGVVVRSSVLEDLEDEEEKEEDDAMMVARWRRRLGTYDNNVNTHSLTSLNQNTQNRYRFDREMDRENVIKIKYNKIGRRVYDPTLKPNKVEWESIKSIIRSPKRRHELKEDERVLLWRYRHTLVSQPKALVKFLYCVDHRYAHDVDHALALLKQWEKIDVADALLLLSNEFSESNRLVRHVRRFAVDTLSKTASDKNIVSYLLQLCQALRYEPELIKAEKKEDEDITKQQKEGQDDVESKDDDAMASPLARFLISRAVKVRYGNYLHWYLVAEFSAHKR